ncbi:MAG: aminotransferase class IV family protein [Bacteroidota bacterium]
MSPLFETIRIKDGVLQNLEYHNSRMNHCRKILFGASRPLNLENIIRIPNENRQGIYKCKIIYTKNIEQQSFELYTARSIDSLKLVTDDSIAYQYKTTDRSRLDKLFAQREKFDDVLIIKNGFITDTSFSNIIFYDGSQWLTPSNPLLNGTMRAHLLKYKLIAEKVIKAGDLPLFRKARLINAMLPFEMGSDVEIENIRFQ